MSTCICLNNKLFNTGLGKSSIFRLKPGQALRASFSYRNAANTTPTLYTGKGFVYGVNGTTMKLTGNQPNGNGILSIVWNLDGTVTLRGREGIPANTPKMKLADNAPYGEFYLANYNTSAITFTNVTLGWIAAAPNKTSISDPASVVCFFNQKTAGAANIRTACSLCTTDNIVSGCLGINFGEFSWYEIALGVGAFILAAVLLRRVL